MQDFRHRFARWFVAIVAIASARPARTAILKTTLCWCVGVALAAVAATASAVPGTFRIEEIYSNADGSVQFIVIHDLGQNDCDSGEAIWAGETLASSGAAPVKTFVFPANLPTCATSNRRILIATEGFAALGIVTPDYVIPNGFLQIPNGTVYFAGVSSVPYTALPNDHRYGRSSRQPAYRDRALLHRAAQCRAGGNLLSTSRRLVEQERAGFRCRARLSGWHADRRGLFLPVGRRGAVVPRRGTACEQRFHGDARQVCRRPVHLVHVQGTGGRWKRRDDCDHVHVGDDGNGRSAWRAPYRDRALFPAVAPFTFPPGSIPARRAAQPR